MKSAIGPLVAIMAAFIAVLFVLGAGFGRLEITIWFAALIVATVFTVRHYRKAARRNQDA